MLYIKSRSKKYKGHSEYVTSVAFSHDESRIVSGHSDGTLRIWHNDAMRMTHMALRQRLLGEPGLPALVASYRGASELEQKRYGRSVIGLSYPPDFVPIEGGRRRRGRNLDKFTITNPTRRSRKHLSRSSAKSKKSKSRSIKYKLT